MDLEKNSLLEKKDYFLISFIGISFALFSLPILKNIGVSFLPISFSTAIYLILFFLTLSNFGLFVASVIAKRIPVILQIAKFGAVGAFNTFLDWGVFNILIFATGVSIGIWPSVFSGLGFIVANIGSFFWNKYWTFSSKKGTIVQFFVVSLVGFVIKVGIVYVMVTLIRSQGEISPAQWANIANALGTIFFMVWNFIGYKFWVFKK